MARNELSVGEPHPAAQTAKEYIAAQGWESLAMWQEAFASAALTGENRLAEICSETLARLTKGQTVSDRYVLGLAFTILMTEGKNGHQQTGVVGSGARGEEAGSEHSTD